MKSLKKAKLTLKEQLEQLKKEKKFLKVKC